MAGFNERERGMTPSTAFVPTAGYEAALQVLAQGGKTELSRTTRREIGEKLFSELTQLQARTLMVRYGTMSLEDLYLFIAERAVATIERMDALRYRDRTVTAQRSVNRFLDRLDLMYGETMEKAAYGASDAIRDHMNQSLAPDPRPAREQTFLAWLFGL